MNPNQHQQRNTMNIVTAFFMTLAAVSAVITALYVWTVMNAAMSNLPF